MSCGLVSWSQAGSSGATLWALPSQTGAECRQYMAQEHPNQSVCHSRWASAKRCLSEEQLGALATVLGPAVYTPGSCGYGEYACSRTMVRTLCSWALCGKKGARSVDHHKPTEALEVHLSPSAPSLCLSLQGHSLIGGEIEA